MLTSCPHPSQTQAYELIHSRSRSCPMVTAAETCWWWLWFRVSDVWMSLFSSLFVISVSIRVASEGGLRVLHRSVVRRPAALHLPHQHPGKNRSQSKEHFCSFSSFCWWADPGRERTQSADPLPLPRPEGRQGSGLHDGRDGPQVHRKWQRPPSMWPSPLTAQPRSPPLPSRPSTRRSA